MSHIFNDQDYKLYRKCISHCIPQASQKKVQTNQGYLFLLYISVKNTKFINFNMKKHCFMD